MEYLSKIFYLYILRDPNTNEVRYVGKTGNPKVRLSTHIRAAKYHARNPRETWIHGLILNGQEPAMEILEIHPEGTWESRERFLIDFYRQEGYNLTNVAIGGYGGRDLKKPKKERPKLLYYSLG